VVTKIDQNAGDELAHEMLVGKGQSIGDYHAHKASVEGHQRSLGIIWGKLKKQSLTGDEKNALWEEVETRRASIDALKCQMRGCVVDARSSHVVARLKREKAKYLLDGERLPVFCVSNLHYAIHKGAADREGAILDIESTGIPSLRAYALRLAAEVVWKDQEMIFNKLKVAFHGVHSWALRQPVPRTEGLLDAIKKVKSSWEDISEAAAGQCFERFTKEVSGKLLAEHASSNDAAMSYLRRIIEDWHPRTFLAFFRHEGKHATQAVGSHSWNESFIEWQSSSMRELSKVPSRLRRVPSTRKSKEFSMKSTSNSTSSFTETRRHWKRAERAFLSPSHSPNSCLTSTASNSNTRKSNKDIRKP
jgi:hypothetical protein